MARLLHLRWLASSTLATWCGAQVEERPVILMPDRPMSVRPARPRAVPLTVMRGQVAERLNTQIAAAAKSRAQSAFEPALSRSEDVVVMERYVVRGETSTYALPPLTSVWRRFLPRRG
jgi:hypothetical protein